MASGKGDMKPPFPDDPRLAASRRVTITLIREASPISINFDPDRVGFGAMAGKHGRRRVGSSGRPVHCTNGLRLHAMI
jgi:hypothetical protein